MDLAKLEKIIKLVLKETPNNSYYASSSSTSKVRHVINIAHITFPEHEEFFINAYDQTKSKYYANTEIRSTLKHILNILTIEKSSQEKVKELKFFETANDKLKQAGLSFQEKNYTSVFHNLNTALELVLKDKLGIPITITKVNTSRIIDVLVKHKIQPYLYLKEAKKHIVIIDNNAKHKAYKPTKVDCINGIKVMEELIPRLKKADMKLTEEIRKKIYEEL